MIDFDTFKKLPKNVRDLGKFIVAKGFKNMPKVQKIAQSGHTAHQLVRYIAQSYKCSKIVIMHDSRVVLTRNLPIVGTTLD